MALSEPVGGQAAHWRPGPDVYTAAMLGGDQPFGLEQPQRVARCHPGNAVVGHQLCLTGQPIACRQSLPAYRRTQVVGYLFVDGTIT